MTALGDAWISEMWQPCREVPRHVREMDRAAHAERNPLLTDDERAAARQQHDELAEAFGDAQDFPESA